jgi:FkbM family methyltransferase
MNLRKLARNWADSARFTPSAGDRVRYLYWLYASRAGLGGSLELSLRHEGVGTVRLSVRVNATDRFIASEVFEHRCYRVEGLVDPATILDLGGNIGLSSVYFSRAYPAASIAVVEPVPANLALLKRNLAANGATARVFEGAIGTEPGTIRMALSERDSDHRVASGGEAGVEVRAYTVPEVMEAMGWSAVDLLKMDIEGYEAELLAGNPAWLSSVRAAIMELHPPYGEAAFRADMTASGFHVERLPSGLFLLRR